MCMYILCLYYIYIYICIHTPDYIIHSYSCLAVPARDKKRDRAGAAGLERRSQGEEGRGA